MQGANQGAKEMGKKGTSTTVESEISSRRVIEVCLTLTLTLTPTLTLTTTSVMAMRQ